MVRCLESDRRRLIRAGAQYQRSMSAESPISSYAAAVGYLKSGKSRGVRFGLERMRELSKALGDPHAQIPCIHIAGTNGKGSVAAMLEAILREAGWRTGLYTSPHLVRLGERIQVNRRPLAEDEITGYVREMVPVVTQLESAAGPDAAPSYFEFMTAMAFLHFVQQGCDVAVIEVGMGGRQDATNVVTPLASVITSIGLDHCEVLGGSVAAIAREKAGIIKPRCPVIIGHLPAEAEQVVRKVAGENEAPVKAVIDVFGDNVADYPATNLEGRHQRVNAGVAAVAAGLLPARWRINGAGIERALRQVNWPARWQRRFASGRLVIIDSSHNAEGAGTLDASLGRLVAETGRSPIVVVGVLGLARAQALMEVVCRHARHLHLVVPAQARACSFDQLRALVPGDFAGGVVDSALAALFPSADVCTVGEPGDAVVVTGSIYLAGEVLSRLDPTLGPCESDLQDF